MSLKHFEVRMSPEEHEGLREQAHQRRMSMHKLIMAVLRKSGVLKLPSEDKAK